MGPGPEVVLLAEEVLGQERVQLAGLVGERAGEAGANGVFPLVERVGFYGWKNVVSCEFISGVD